MEPNNQTMINKCAFKKAVCKFLFSIFALTLFATNAEAQKEAYAVFDNGTLTFYYNTTKGNFTSPNIVYDINPVNDPGWLVKSNDITTVVFDKSFVHTQPTDLSKWFQGCTNLTTITDIVYLNTKDVTTMENLFAGCSNIIELNLAYFNTDQVENMKGMFKNCSNLTKIYVGPSWTTENVTESDGMFDGCYLLEGEWVDKTYFPSYTNYYKYSDIGATTDNTYAKINGLYNNGGLLSHGKLAYCVCANQKSSPICYNYNLNNNTLIFRFDDQWANLSISSDKVFNIEVDATTPTWNNLSVYINTAQGMQWIEKTDFQTVIFDSNFSDPENKILSCANWFNGFSSLTTLKNFANLDISQVTDFSEMFAGCETIENIVFNEKYINNPSDEGRKFEKMFQNCTNIKTIDIRPIILADNDQKSYMFNGCTNLTTITVSSTTTTNIDPNSDMFTGCDNLSGDIKDVFTLIKEAYGILDNTNVLTLYYDGLRDTRKISAYKDYDIYKPSYTNPGWYNDWYQVNPNADCHKIKEVYTDESFKNYVPEKEEDSPGCESWFAGLTNATKIDISNLNMENVTSIGSMFENCENLTEIIFPDPFITDKIRYMEGIFAGCKQLPGEIIAQITTTVQIRDYTDLFKDCVTLTELDLSNWELKYDPDFNSGISTMFRGCTNLKTITFPNNEKWNSSQFKLFHQMFENCENLEVLDLRMFDIRDAEQIQSMFENCKKLKTILVDPEKWKTDNATTFFNMFSGCISLVGENGTTYNENHIDREYARVDSDGAPGYLTDGKYTISYKNIDQDGNPIKTIQLKDYQKKYEYDDPDITIYKPTSMTGYTFNKWSYTISTDKTNTKDGGEQINIPQNSVGNYEITITWDVDSYSVKLPENMEFVPESTDNKFEYNSTVTFKAKEGFKVIEGPTSKTQIEGLTITPDENIKYQYSFTMPYVPEGKVEIEATLVERAKYTVSFETEYGTAPETQTVNEEEQAQEPEFTHTQPGWEFKGWKTEKGDLFDFSQTITENITLYAIWQRAPLKITPTLSETDKYISFPKDWKLFCKKQETYAQLSYSITNGGNPTACNIIIETIEGSHQYPTNNGIVQISTLPQFPGVYACSAVFVGDEDFTLPSDTIDFTLEITAVQGLILQLYKNVIFVNNRSEMFNTYQWYRYGDETDEKLPNGERQYFTEPTLKGSYWALLNGKIHACPMENPISVKNEKVSIKPYPNPAIEGEPFAIEIINFDPDTKYTMIISNSNGNIVKQLDVDSSQITLTLPRGIYTGALISSGEKQSFKLIVK